LESADGEYRGGRAAPSDCLTASRDKAITAPCLRHAGCKRAPWSFPVRLRDSEVDELERELTEDDLCAPDDPAEKTRVDNARRLLADRALVAELAAAGFTGPVFEIAETELAAYGIAVMMAWMRTRQIFGKCQEIGRPASDTALEWSRDDRLEIAIETTARGLRYFIDNALRAGRWDPRRGATLRTFFVGACLLQFSNVFELWATEQRHWAQMNDDGEPIPDDAVGGADPQWADPTGDTAVRTRMAEQQLDRIPDPKTREAAWLVFGLGASHAEAGQAVGLSAGAIEGRLYRLLRRAS
jgi:hypothetical protein